MSRRRLLDDEQSEKMYQEYLTYLYCRPLKLCARYGIGRKVFWTYVNKKHKRAA